MLGAYIFYYDVIEIQPKAEVQSKLISSMYCDEVLSFPSSAPVYSKENRILLNEKTKICNEAIQLAAQKEKERLDELLKDPNSYESLSGEYLKLIESLPKLQTQYDILQNETSIAHEKLTDTTTRLAEVRKK